MKVRFKGVKIILVCFRDEFESAMVNDIICVRVIQVLLYLLGILYSPWIVLL